jgi:class 3 adenylate cyclase
MGGLIMEHAGTLERFTGDGLVIVLNDPVEQPNPEERSVRPATAAASTRCKPKEGARQPLSQRAPFAKWSYSA